MFRADFRASHKEFVVRVADDILRLQWLGKAEPASAGVTFIERTEQRFTLSTTDMMAAIESFLTIVPRELAKGNIVELGDFGNFWLRTDTEGAEAQADVRADQITGVLPRFNQGKEFKRTLDTIDFVKLS